MKNAAVKNLLLVTLVSMVSGCAVTSIAKTSRYAFSPPLSPLLKTKREPAAPIARQSSFAWQTVYQELAPGMAMKQQANVITITQSPGGSPVTQAITQQAQQRADDASARGDAGQAYVDQQMAVASSNIDSSISVVNGTFGAFNSLAAYGRKMNIQNYGTITKNIAKQLHLLGSDAPEGSQLHIEYYYGLEPSTGRNFSNGFAAMFGGSAEANQQFMVTAVLTQPDGRQISATRLMKMVWFAGEGNLDRPFPEGYEEFKATELPVPDGLTSPLLNYLVLNQLAIAAVDEIRKKLDRPDEEDGL